MKKFGFSVGLVIIIILLLLQTRFNVFLQVDTEGYAIRSNTVKSMLLTDPDELIEEDTIELYTYNPLDYIYSRAGSYYMGENKKTQIDMTFPLYVNGGAGLYFTGNNGTLFDVDYETADVYQGLYTTGVNTYNPGGDRADGVDFVFYGTGNGFFYNLGSFTYFERGKEREVSPNSAIYFTDSYFTYCEPEGDVLNYQVARFMTDNTKVIVNGEEMPYHELLVRLGVVSDKKPGKYEGSDSDGEDEIVVPTPEVNDQVNDEVIEADDQELDSAEDAKNKDKTKKEKEKAKKDTSREPSSSASSAGSKGSGSKGGKPSANASSGANKGEKDTTAKGVRPDSMRPDKVRGEKEPTVRDYVKPVVEYRGVSAGVYRIMLDMYVKDPSQRIDRDRRVQYEFYEIGADGKEKLVYRTYSGTSGTVTAGDGNIKPDTNYRVNVFFTYKNEYDETVTESVKSDIYVKTKPFNADDAKVTIRREIDEETDIVYGSIPYYYDNYMEITNFTYKLDESSEEKLENSKEYLYGISNKAGIVLTLKKEGIATPIVMNLDSGTIAKFKNGTLQDLDSLRVLQPNSKYTYEITMTDYFGNEIKVENGTGQFETCKSRPVGTIELTRNVIGDVSFKLGLSDPDESAIKAAGATSNDDYDLYFVLATEDVNKVSTTKVWSEVQKYIANNNSRVYEETDDKGNVTKEEGTVHYVYKINKEQYLTNGELGFEGLALNGIKTIDLNTKYYCYILGDFDLNNRKGEVRHEPVARFEFRSAGLSSLGNIYVNTTIAGITAHGANIIYELNENKTNDVLTRLLSDIEFDIDTANGSEPSTDSKIIFNSDAMKIFTGYYVDGDGNVQTYTRPTISGSDVPLKYVQMDETYFDGSMVETIKDGCPYYLQSMTDYKIVPKIYATYNGKKYEMKVTLSKSAFKTMREPAKVDVKNVVLAGGTLRFDVHIADPDESITGVSNKVVVMNLYDEGSNFVRAVRYQKNQYDEAGNPIYYSEEITGLDPDKRYFMEFRAADYNEGYDNTTYVPNKLLLEYHIDDIVDIRGSIKLHGLDGIDGDASKLMSNLYVDIEDHARIMTGKDSPYYIRIERDGVDVTSSYSNTVFGDYTLANSHIRETNHYIVDKGNHTYKATLYIYYNTKELILDTLTFTTEDVMLTINSAQEFYDLIKADSNKESNGVGVATGRYCVTADLNLGNSGGIPKSASTDPDSGETITYDANKKPVAIATTFNGEIDFQGFTVSFDKSTNSDGWFTNLGPKAEIYNLVLECETSSTTRIYDQGVICDRNYGHIHDIYIHYKGGNALDNEFFGLVTRYNTVSGIIENFVIHSDDEGNYMPFTAYRYAGLVCSENQGVVRYGYVYGTDINAARGKTTEDIRVGGIVGSNERAGQVYDVYSSVNIILDNDNKHTNYGSVVGAGGGQLRNMYNTGVPTKLNGQKKDPNGTEIIGTVTYGNKSAYRNLCYWNEDNTEFVNATYQQIVSLENLNDYSWQKSILESHFNVQPVEVGYYPHVIWSTDEMPQQEYVKLPSRTSTRLVELLSSEVLSYSADGESAEVLFRFSNTRNAIISELDVSDLTVTLDQESAVTEDGFTTIKGTLSNPQAYHSEYEVNSIKCSLNGNSQTIVYDGVNYIKPVIKADFYRLIHNADEWYDYVVCAPTENARLANDIDFKDVLPSRIQVPDTYTGKLDSIIPEGQSYGYSLKNIHFKSTDKVKDYAYVFRTINGSVSNICIDNMTLEVANKAYNGFALDLYGTVENVHMNKVTIKGSDYVAPFINRMQAGSFLQNCSVNDLTIDYAERTNINSTAYVGGLVSYMTSSKILNCYAANIDIKVNDVKSAEGIGGIVGRVSYGLVENVYATGDLVGRCQNVGGIVGYYESDAVTCDVKNAITKVNVTSYQDAVGGMIGQLKLTNNLINPRNNLSGVAYGNVTCSNSTSENVSYTIGYMSGSDGAMYGAEFQLINGLPMPKNHFDPETGALTDHTHGLIDYEQAIDPATYTDSVLLNMDGVYDYSYAAKELIPKLYYAESTELLPFQKDIRITDLKKSDDLLSISSVSVNENEKRIQLIVKGPAGYTITGLTIEDLLFYDLNSEKHPTDLKIPSNGELSLFVYYYPENEQKHFKDQYFVTEMSYVAGDASTVGKSTFNDTPVSIPLMMFGEIKDIDTWNYYLGTSNNSGNYENFRVVADINFGSGASYAKNVKVGRLRGVGTGSDKVTLENINITDKSTNLLFRVNSELSNFAFKNCSVNSTGRDGYALIATSCGQVKNLSFNDIETACAGSYSGLIAWQYGGSIEGITMENIQVNTGKTKTNYYVGGLVGYSNYGTLIKDVTAKNVTAYGRGYIGGIVGYIVGSLENIEGEDFNVTGCYYRIGGIAGCNASARQTNGNSAYVNNISLKGTPTAWDDNGRVTASTTVISIDPAEAHVKKEDGTSESYDVGGLIGYCGVYVNGFAQKLDSGSNNSIGNVNGFDYQYARPILVDGIVVKGYGNYIGGAYGRCVDIACAKVTNTSVSVVKNTDYIYNYMGALAGYVSYNVYGCEVENCKVDSFNHGRCGIMTGYNGSTFQYNYAENSELYANSDKTDLLTGYGGITGYTGGAVNYSFAKNIIVDASASNMQGVGAVIGYMNNQVVGCGIYCDPINEAVSPSAQSQYYVKGNKYVGGVAGYQYSNTLLNCYSNINVIGNTYAGGLSGRYENNYTETMVNGKAKRSFTTTTIRGNYFAGTVEAVDYAGGIVGSLGSAESNTEGKTTGRVKDVTGADNEAAYTYRNLMVAEYINSTGDSSHAYAFAGNLDGFEGMANYATLDDRASDADRVKYARLTMFWEDSQVNGVKLKDMLASSAPEYARNTSAVLAGKRFAYYAGKYTVVSDATSNYTGNGDKGQYNQDDSNDRSNWNVRLVSTNNMECSNMYWSLYWNNRTKSSNTYMNGYMAMNSFRWTLLTKDVPANVLVAPYLSYGVTGGVSYLPQTRNNTDTTSINGFNAKKQIAEGMNMPLPRSYPERMAGRAMMAMFMMPVDNYGILYASDVDRINVEFGQDLVDNGYFVLKAGGKVVDRQIIHQRVYTYSYDQSVNLELCYGEVDMFSYMYDYYDYNKGEYKDGRTEDGVFDYPDLYLSEFADDTYKVASLRHHIMTYGTKYYYISDEGLVEGSGSSVVEEDDEKTRIVDSSATTTPGKYLSIYNGHALMEDGSVVDITTKQPIRTIEKGIKCLNNAFAKDYDPANAVTAALQNFSFNGTNTTVFHKYTDYDGFGNSGQFMTSANGDIVFIDKDLDNYKDAVTFYLKGDEQYCTIVDHEGYIQDLYRGGGTSSINAPEDMHMSGVVYATNNLNCTAPFILVEYANGGIVGYNYMTGEYLFDESVRNVMDLTDYIKVYFEGDKPEKSYADYAANAKLAKMAITADRLSAMVLGANTGLPVDEHESNGETAFDPDSSKAEAQGLGALTGDKTALREGETGAKSEDEDDKSLDYSLSDSSITDDDKDNNSSDKKSGSEDEKTSTGDGTSTGSSDISVELERPVGITSVQGLGLSVGLDNDGTALGNGTGGTGLGTSLANGIGGASNTGLNEELDAGKSQAAGEGTGAGTEEVNGEGLGDGEEGIKAGPSGLEKPEKEKTEESEGLDDSDDKLGSDKSEVGKADKDKIEDEEFDPYELGIDEDKESEAGKDKSSKIKDADDKSEADKAEKPESDKDKPIGKDSEADDEAPIHDGKEASEADNLNIKTIEEIDMTSADPTEEPSDPAKVVETKQTLIAVYNAATGEYEILDMTKYMSDPTYKSENSRLAVRDLTVYSDYHAEQKDTKKENGLWMYILSILAVLGGIGGGVYFKKKHNMKV